MKKLNLPNKLTVIRMLMVPLCIIAIVLPEAWVAPNISAVIAAVIFIAASLTDMLDGQIARRYNMVTDFGKFMDPLADKFLVIGSLLAAVYRYDNLRAWLFWVTLVVIFRELAVTSIRLVANTSAGVVVAANWLGKIKTVCQIVSISAILLEPVIYSIAGIEMSVLLVTMISCGLMLIFTVWSGINYLATYWKYLDTEK